MNTRFSDAILHPTRGDIGLIAEIKFESPGSGTFTSFSTSKLGSREDMGKRIKAYEAGGADALSLVVARDGFGGDVGMIEEAKKITHLPIFAKDFITDAQKIALFKAKGADAVLLIAKIVDRVTLKNLVQRAFEVDIEPVVEVQNPDELRSVLALSEDVRLSSVEARQRVECVAVNARDLGNFSLDIKRACTLLKDIPSGYIKLAFSGIKARRDVLKYKNAGAKGVLVGTTLMKADRPDALLKELKGI